MKKLIIIFKDKSKVTYTMRDGISYLPYLNRHSRSSIENAVLQQYPKKNNEPIVLV